MDPGSTPPSKLYLDFICSTMPEVRLTAALFLGLTCLQLTTAQYFIQPRDAKAAGGGEAWARQSQCPQVASRGSAECAGQRSTCWSPGVRDLDCPSSGLCCFNGCVNICEGPQSPPPPPPPRTEPVLVPIIPM